MKGLSIQAKIVVVGCRESGLRDELRESFPEMQFILHKPHLIKPFYEGTEALGLECIYKEKVWPIDSGEVEISHRYIPQERLKIAGAWWLPEHINPMLWLCVVRAND